MSRRPRGLLLLALVSSFGYAGTAWSASSPDAGVRLLWSDAAGVHFLYTPAAPVLTPPASDPHVRVAPAAGADAPVLPVVEDADLVEIDGRPIPARILTIALPPAGTPEVTVTIGGTTSRGNVVLAAPDHPRGDAHYPLSVPVTVGPLAEGAAPASPVLGAWITMLRAQRVLRLVLAPAAYVAATRTLVWTTALDVTVRFPGTDGAAATTLSAGPRDPFEDVYAGVLLNYEDGRAWRVASTPPARAMLSGSGDSFASSSVWYKVTVRGKGLFTIGYDDLRSAGLTDADIRSIDPGTIRLYTGARGGRELDPDSLPPDDEWMTQVARIVSDSGTAAQFERGDYVAFYGWGTRGNEREWDPAVPDLWYENPYTDDNVFWLTWGGTFGEPVRAVEPVASDATPSIAADASFVSRVHVEDNTYYDPSVNRYSTLYGKFGLRWERWWWGGAHLGTDPATFSIAQLPGAVTGPDVPVRVRARIWGGDIDYTRLPRCVPQHQFDLRVNGQRAALASWYSSVAFDVDTTGYWASARDSLSFKTVLRYDSSGTCIGNLDPNKDGITDPVFDPIFLAWYEIDYPRRFEAVNDWLEFTAPAGAGAVRRFALTGFTAAAHVHVYDVTYQTAPREILPVATRQPGEESASIVVQDTLGAWPRRYVATTEERFTHAVPARATLTSPGLRDPAAPQADYLVIAHPTLMQTAQRLADFRAGNVEDVPDARTLAVRLSDLYDQFSWGLVDPSGIRNFISHAYRTWARRPSYVALIGDASWDYKNYMHASDGSKSFVPGFIGSGRQFVSNVLTDTWYVETDPGQLDAGDLFIGRIPIRTESEGSVVINDKLIPYENQPAYGVWRSRILIAADDTSAGCLPDAIFWSHTSQAEDVCTAIPPQLDIVKLYMVLYPYAPGQCVKPVAHDALVGWINSGVLSLNYTGHGWWDVLGHEQFLRISDVPALANGPRLPFLVAASCAVGKFDEPATEGISETAIKMTGGGAIATFSATDLAFSFSNSLLNIALSQELFPSLSLAAPRTFGAAGTRAILRSANAEQYAVLGDPAIRVATPARPASLAIDGGALVQGAIATVDGSVVDSTGAVDPTYSGTADVEVHGSATYVDAGADDRTGNRFYGADDFYLPGPVVYRGQVPVSAGRFSARFVVPADSAVLGTKGRVRVYVTPATSAPRQDALAALDSVHVVPGTLAADDSLDLLALDFPDGSTTVTGNATLTIRIADEHGVNLTDLPGSQVDLVLDGQTYDVTSRFSYDPGSFTSGRALFPLPGLRLGPHTVQIAASDAYGNRAVYPPTLSPLRFEVATPGRLALSEVMTYPDPPSRGTWILAMLDPRSTASQVKCTVHVYTVSGRRIRTLETVTAPVGTTGNRQVQILWDGRDSGGDEVATGLYLYKVLAEDMATGARADAMGRGPLIRR